MATRPVCPASVPNATIVCEPGRGATATGACSDMSCSIPTSLHLTIIALSTAMTNHSAMPLALPTSNSACTRVSISNSCRLASIASAAILISCDGVEIHPFRPLSRRSYALCSSRLARQATSTSMTSRNESTGMATKSWPSGISTSAELLQYFSQITAVQRKDYTSTSPKYSADSCRADSTR